MTDLGKNSSNSEYRVSKHTEIAHILISACVHAKLFQSCPTLCDSIECSLLGSFLCPQDFSGKNIGMGCHALLQGIFPTQNQTYFSLSPALADGFFTTNTIWEAHTDNQDIKITKQGFSGGLALKNTPTNAGDTGSTPGQEDPLEKEMATHSSILT